MAVAVAVGNGVGVLVGRGMLVGVAVGKGVGVLVGRGMLVAVAVGKGVGVLLVGTEIPVGVAVGVAEPEAAHGMTPESSVAPFVFRYVKLALP